MSKTQRDKAELMCPGCEASSIETRMKLEKFLYGEGKQAIEIEANVPVRHCASCDLEFVDDDGFRARHEAVCQHLGVMNPTEVRELRAATYGTREALAEATGIGVASIARWEAGTLPPSTGYDRFLRILRFDEVRARLAQVCFEIRTRAEPERPFLALGLNEEATRAGELAMLQFDLRGNRPLPLHIH